MRNPYREYGEKHQWADRDFRNGDRVVFVGPPDGEFYPDTIADPAGHKLYKKRGQIRIGVSEDIRVFPDDPNMDLYWVKFDDDPQPMRQVQGSWLVKEQDLASNE